MKTLNLALLGFGNVNRTLIDLLRQKRAELRERYGIDWRITGVASRRIGWRVNAAGFDVTSLLQARNADTFAAIGGRGVASGFEFLDRNHAHRVDHTAAAC